MTTTSLFRADELEAQAARAMLAALKQITGIFAVSKGMQKAHKIAHAAIAQAEAAGIKAEG